MTEALLATVIFACMHSYAPMFSCFEDVMKCAIANRQAGVDEEKKVLNVTECLLRRARKEKDQ